jgi:hypothetical protein
VLFSLVRVLGVQVRGLGQAPARVVVLEPALLQLSRPLVQVPVHLIIGAGLSPSPPRSFLRV